MPTEENIMPASAAQRGRDLLLKVDTSATGTNFVSVAGLRTKSFAFGAETVDVTHQDSAGQWRELLSGAGTKRARISGAGVFRDEASDETVRSLAFAGTIRDWQVVVPDFGTLQGKFQITALEYGGAHDREATFEITLESAGALAFTTAT
jgi:TP901-1 family phage major tail protein